MGYNYHFDSDHFVGVDVFGHFDFTVGAKADDVELIVGSLHKLITLVLHFDFSIANSKNYELPKNIIIRTQIFKASKSFAMSGSISIIFSVLKYKFSLSFFFTKFCFLPVFELFSLFLFLPSFSYLHILLFDSFNSLFCGL